MIGRMRGLPDKWQNWSKTSTTGTVSTDISQLQPLSCPSSSFQLNLQFPRQRTLTPGVHLEQYSVEDHRHDLRQLLYPPFFTSMAARAIDAVVERLEHPEENEEVPNDVD